MTADVDSQLTVVLLLKDRVDFTWRWLDYVNFVNYPFKILIADGGSDEQVARRFQDGNPYRSVDITYIRYPHDVTLADFFVKKADVIGRVSTPMVLMSSNDDFYLVKGLSAATRFLLENKDYASARSEMYFFAMVRDRVHRTVSTVSGEMKHLHRFSNPLYHLAKMPEGASERLREFMQLQIPTLWHDVYRRNALAQEVDILRASGLNDLRLMGHLLDTLSMLSGKVKRLDGLHCLHQSNSSESLGKEIQDLHPTYLDWITTPEWSAEFDIFVKLIAERVSNIDNISHGEAFQTVRSAYVRLFLTARIAEDCKRFPTWIRPHEFLLVPMRRLRWIWAVRDFVRWSLSIVKRGMRYLSSRNIVSWRQNLNLSRFGIGPYSEELSDIARFLAHENRESRSAR